MTALALFEIALAYAAHERVADKTGRTGWHPTESMRLTSEPNGYPLLDRRAVPVEFIEWCWPL